MRLTARPYWTAASLLVVTLPLLLLVAWYLGAGYTRFERYRRATGDDVTLNAELLQLFVHDELHRHLRRLNLGTPPRSLDRIEFSVPADGMATLEQDARSSGKRSYVKVFLRKDDEMHKAKIRLQGRRHWHHIGEQKSFKVRTNKGDLVDGLRTFNLVNDVTPFGLEEQIVLDVAKELDLLTPEYRPVRVRMNNTDVGVYRLVAAPDEGLLRRAERMPGSIYSGRLDRPCDPAAPGERKDKPCGFAKLGARDAAERDRFDEIFRLHAVLRDGSTAELRDYALERLDLERFARFEALDVVFGGDQHDEGASFKLYYDAYRGRFEPIAMDFRAFRHDEKVNLATNILQRRLQTVPEYMRLRNQWIHRLVTGLGSPAEVRARVDRWFERLRPELSSDPYWDAYKLLPKASEFHRLMVRPMTVGRWLLVSQVELETHAIRSRFLTNQLEAAQIRPTTRTSSAGTFLDVVVSGLGAFRVNELAVEGTRKTACVLEDPGVVIEPAMKVGKRRATPVPTRWSLPVRCTSGAPEGLWVTAENLVTGRVRRIWAAAASRPPAGATPPAHARAAAAETITVGPGIVRYDRDTVFRPHMRVDIAPGTTVRLGPGVSVTFEGPVEARGTAADPIRFEAAQPGVPFGGIALLGPKTQGSRLRHVTFSGGSIPAPSDRYLPSFFTLYDTSDIQLSDVAFEDIAEAEDVVHATYVNGLVMTDVSVKDAPTDAIDLEIVQAKLRGLRIAGAGDECLDLMGAKLVVNDSVLVGCTNNAVSAGERTRIVLDGVLIAKSKVAVLAKNASEAVIARSVVYDVKHALRTNKKDVHYSEPSRIEAESLFAYEVEDLKKQGGRTKIAIFRSVRGLPGPEQLVFLRRDVLGLSQWSDEALREFVGGLQP